MSYISVDVEGTLPKDELIMKRASPEEVMPDVICGYYRRYNIYNVYTNLEFHGANNINVLPLDYFTNMIVDADVEGLGWYWVGYNIINYDLKILTAYIDMGKTVVYKKHGRTITARVPVLEGTYKIKVLDLYDLIYRKTTKKIDLRSIARAYNIETMPKVRAGEPKHMKKVRKCILDTYAVAFIHDIIMAGKPLLYIDENGNEVSLGVIEIESKDFLDFVFIGD